MQCPLSLRTTRGTQGDDYQTDTEPLRPPTRPSSPAPTAPVRFCTRAAMIHDSASHRIFRISELTSLTASQLVLISPKSTASLACVCRYLEEPALSILWQTQRSLDNLLKALPEETWSCDDAEPPDSSVCGPNPCSKNRVLKFKANSVQDHKGSAAGGLEESPTLRVMDAPS